MIEKPEPGETSSTLAAFGRYLVTPEILEIFKNIPVGNAGELWFVDSVIEYIRRGGSMCSHILKTGRWYTVGDPVGYSEAVIAAADLQ